MSRCISAFNLMPYLPYCYLYESFIYCTCSVPTISVLNLAIFPCYSNLLLRRRRWTRILRRGVLGYVLPRLPFLWCYGVFHYSISLRVILVFKDLIYVIIILYTCDIWLSVDTFGCVCGTIDPGSCIRWVLGFGLKTGYDTARFASTHFVNLSTATKTCVNPPFAFLKGPTKSSPHVEKDQVIGMVCSWWDGTCFWRAKKLHPSHRRTMELASDIGVSQKNPYRWVFPMSDFPPAWLSQTPAWMSCKMTCPSSGVMHFIRVSLAPRR
jgi:hypothetical protein